MSLCLCMGRMLHLSPAPVRMQPSPLTALERAILPARVEVWVSSSGPGRLRDETSGAIYEGAFDAAPAPASTWRVDRLDDRSARRRPFGVHRPQSAPALVPSAPLLGGRPGIRTVPQDDSGFIMRFGWTLSRPFAMFALLEGSGTNRVISESINRMDDPIPDLANISDFATSAASGNPVPIAKQGSNETPGTTPLTTGSVHLVAAIWALNETFVRVDGVQEGHEAGVSNGLIADSLSLLNNPTVMHGQNRWLGVFGEYLLVSGALDPARIDLIETDLAQRYGLTLGG